MPGLKRHALFWLGSAAVFFAGLYLFREILLPFVAGMAAAYLLDPVCDRLQRLGMSRTLATTVVTMQMPQRSSPHTRTHPTPRFNKRPDRSR